MPSKTIYFNKTIYLKNLTSYWPIWTAYLLVCLYRLPFSLFINLEKTQLAALGADDATALSRQFIWVLESSMHPLPLFIFAIVTAVAVFSYLYTPRYANMIHSLPVNRETLFITNSLSGISFLFIPQALAFLASIFVCFARQVTNLEYLLYWLLIMTGMAFFSFSLSVFSCMITGHWVAPPVIFLLLNYLFVGCLNILNTIASTILYGFSLPTYGKVENFLSPYPYLKNHLTWQFEAPADSIFIDEIGKNLLAVGFYSLAAIILLILALLIYKKRHLETAGDIISISFVKPLFRWIASFTGAGLTAYFAQIIFLVDYNLTGNGMLPLLVLMLLGGCITFFVSEMLLKKSVKVFTKKRISECCVFALLITGLLVSIECDLFGLEKTLPKEEDIESVLLYGTYPLQLENKDFSEILDIHRDIIEAKDEYEAYFKNYKNNTNYVSVILDYTLKNGRHINRNYYIPVENYYLEKKDYALNRILDLSNEANYYLPYHFSYNYENVSFIDGSIGYWAEGGLVSNNSLTPAQCDLLYAAVKKDIQAGNYRIYDYSLLKFYPEKVYFNTLFFTYHIPKGKEYIDYSGVQTVTEDNYIYSTAINPTTDCQYTVACLKKLGLIDENHVLKTQKEAGTYQ